MMDYEQRRRHRRWLMVFLIHACVVAYLVISRNPLLYSHKELRRELLGSQAEAVKPLIIANLQTPADLTPSLTSHWRGATERTGTTDSSKTHDRDFVRGGHFPLPEDVSPRRWVADESGAYIASSTPNLTTMAPSGELSWQYKFLAGSGAIMTPAVDAHSVYALSENGTLVSLQKESGSLRWWLRLAAEVNSDPLLIGERLLMIVKPLPDEVDRLAERDRKLQPKSRVTTGASHRLVWVDRHTGKVLDYSPLLLIKGEAYLTASISANLLLISNDNRLAALDLETGAIQWTQTLPDPIVGPVILVEGQAYASLASGKIQTWDPLKRGGKFESETDVGRPLGTAPVWLPTYNRLGVVTNESVLHVIDLNKNESAWRFNLDLRDSSLEPLVARLSGRYIEPLGMKWEKKGWTIWSPCGQEYLCVFNPDKGQLISRIYLRGTLVDRPLFVNKDLMVLVREGSIEKPSFALLRLIDGETAKRKAKEQAAKSLGQAQAQTLQKPAAPPADPPKSN